LRYLAVPHSFLKAGFPLRLEGFLQKADQLVYFNGFLFLLTIGKHIADI